MNKKANNKVDKKVYFKQLDLKQKSIGNQA